MRECTAGHGGWNENMAEHLGKDGMVTKVDDDGDVHVKSGTRSFCWNAKMVELVEASQVVALAVSSRRAITLSVGPIGSGATRMAAPGRSAR